MKSFILCLLTVTFGVSAVQAAPIGFAGYYDPANWTLTQNGGDGWVFTAGAPVYIDLWSSNTQSGSSISTDFTIVVPAAGTWTFDWYFYNYDSCCEEAGYLLNGVYHLLATTSGALGTESILVSAGDIIGFRETTTNDDIERSSLSVSDFDAPVPEPATFVLLGFGLLALGVGSRLGKRSRIF